MLFTKRRINSLASATSLALLVSAGISCATMGGGSAKKSAIKPSDVDKAFAEFDKVESFGVTKEGVVGKNAVEFTTTKIAKYDAFLQEAATIKGSVVVSNAVMDNLEGLFQELAAEKAGPVADYDVLANSVRAHQAEF